MQHLGPIRSKGTSSSDGLQSAKVSASSPGKSNVSQNFSVLAEQLSRIRSQQNPVQNNINTANSQTAQLAKMNSNEMNFARNSKNDERSLQRLHFESNISADNLVMESKVLKDRAEDSGSATEAFALKNEAKMKLDESKEKRKEAEQALIDSENAKKDSGRHSSAQSNIQDQLGQVKLASSVGTSNAKEMDQQVSALSVRALGSPQQSPVLGGVSSNSGGGSTSGAGNWGVASNSGFSNASYAASSGGGSSAKLGGVSSNGGSSSKGSGPTLGGLGNGSPQYANGQNTSAYTAGIINAAGPSAGYIWAAMSLLNSIGQQTKANSTNPNSSANPVKQISLNLNNKSLSEQATAYLEAAMVDTALQGTPTNQQIIFLKAQSNTVHGEAETNVAYWKEVLNENKQLEKQTHDLAKRA